MKTYVPAASIPSTVAGSAMLNTLPDGEPPGRSLGFTLPSGVVNTDDGSPVMIKAVASEATA